MTPLSPVNVFPRAVRGRGDVAAPEHRRDLLAGLFLTAIDDTTVACMPAGVLQQRERGLSRVPRRARLYPALARSCAVHDGCLSSTGSSCVLLFLPLGLS